MGHYASEMNPEGFKLAGDRGAAKANYRNKMNLWLEAKEAEAQAFLNFQEARKLAKELGVLHKLEEWNSL